MRPLGMDPFQRMLEGVGGIEANLPDHLKHLTARIAREKMNEIPLGLQVYTIEVSHRMRRVLRRVTTTMIFYHEQHPIDDDDSE